MKLGILLLFSHFFVLVLEKHVEWNQEVSEKELVCNVCGKTFNNSAKYNAHVDYHKDCNTRNVCEKCGIIHLQEQIN